MERLDALHTVRYGTIEMMGRVLRFRDENEGRFVVAQTRYCTTAVRDVGGSYRLDMFLDGPLTFADRGQAEKLAECWNSHFRDNRRLDPVGVLSVEDFYAAIIDECEDTLVFIEGDRVDGTS